MAKLGFGAGNETSSSPLRVDVAAGVLLGFGRVSHLKANLQVP